MTPLQQALGDAVLETTRPVMQVLATHHGMFARQILILRAGAEPFTEEDEARLEVNPALCPFHLPHSLSTTLDCVEDLESRQNLGMEG